MREINENWLKVWNDKSLGDQSSGSLLANLIKADGFDSGAGDYNEEEWKILCSHFGSQVGLKKDDKVLELGCGAGAFLLSLQREFSCQIFGIDYSESLVGIARDNLDGKFFTSEATQISAMNETFHLIFAHSVLQYFPSLDYAARVIKEAYSSLADNGKIGLLDVNDRAKEVIYHSSRKRKHKNPDEYDLLYANHPHLFCSREEMSGLLTEAGFKKILFYPHVIDTYGNAEFRFNVIAEK